MIQHSSRIPKAAKETLLGVKVRFGLRWRVFSLSEPQGTTRIGIVEDPTLVSGNQIPQKLLSLRAEKERLTNGYPGEARTIGQDMRDPSSQHFSVAEDLKATEDCLMA